MAWIRIDQTETELKDESEVRAFLDRYNIRYERWPLEDRVSPDASPEEILEAYAPEIERLKEAGGYTTADVVAITPETPGLRELIVKFGQEHTHSEDEIRFTLQGSGVFYINPETDPVFAIYVEAGDLLGVPAGARHWFLLCEDHRIRCIRLFQDPSGWIAHYVDNPTHSTFMPVCWGPQYVPPETIDRKKLSLE